MDGDGLDRLLARVEDRIGKTADIFSITLDGTDGKALAWLHRRGEVITRNALKDGRVRVEVRMDADLAGQAKAMFGRHMRKKA